MFLPRMRGSFVVYFIHVGYHQQTWCFSFFSCVSWVQHHLLNYLDTFKSVTVYVRFYLLALKRASLRLLELQFLPLRVSKTAGLRLGSPSLLRAQLCLAAGGQAWRLCLPPRPSLVLPFVHV